MKTAEFAARMKIDNKQALDALDETERGFSELQGMIEHPVKMDRETYRKHADTYRSEVQNTHKIENERNVIKDKYLKEGLTKEKRTVFDHFERQARELRQREIMTPFHASLSSILGAREAAPSTGAEWDEVYEQATGEAGRAFRGKRGRAKVGDIRRQEDLIRMTRDFELRQTGGGEGGGGGSSLTGLLMGLAGKWAVPAYLAWQSFGKIQADQRTYEQVEKGMQGLRAGMGDMSKYMNTHDVMRMIAKGVDEYAASPTETLGGLTQFLRMGVTFGGGGNRLQQMQSIANRMSLGGLFQDQDQARAAMHSAYFMGGARDNAGMIGYEQQLNAIRKHTGRDVGPAVHGMQSLWQQGTSQWGAEISPEAISNWTMAMVPAGGTVTPMTTQVTSRLMSGFGQRGSPLQNMLIREIMTEGKTYWEALQEASDPNKPENVTRLQRAVKKAAGDDPERQKQLYYMLDIPMGAIKDVMGATVKNLKGTITPTASMRRSRAFELQTEESRDELMKILPSTKKDWNSRRATVEGARLAELTKTLGGAGLLGDDPEIDERIETLIEGGVLSENFYSERFGRGGHEPSGRATPTVETINVNASVINLYGGITNHQ